MPSQIQKSIQERISKLKFTRQQIQFQLRRCKFPKTPSLEPRRWERGDDDAAAEQIGKLRSPCQDGKAYDRDEIRTPPLESPRLDLPPPENLCRSSRFFISCGSSSSLITDEIAASSSSSSISSAAIAATEKSSVASDAYVALLTYSPRPYEDFRRSMQEMAEARREHGREVDWEFLQELLFCYLKLNHKKAYRFILGAFVDLVIDLRAKSGEISAAVGRRSFEEALPL